MILARIRGKWYRVVTLPDGALSVLNSADVVIDTRFRQILKDRTMDFSFDQIDVIKMQHWINGGGAFPIIHASNLNKIFG